MQRAKTVLALKMSVLYSTDIGFFISHAMFINACYLNVSDNVTKVNYELKNELFKIDTPYSSHSNLEAKQRKRPLQIDCEKSDKLGKDVSFTY